jgi:hypothetical protein
LSPAAKLSHPDGAHRVMAVPFIPFCMQLWGYSLTGDLTVTVQEQAGLLQKKFWKKFGLAKLSNT